MKQKVWLTRDMDKNAVYAIFIGNKPFYDEPLWDNPEYSGAHFLKSMCPKQFHQFCNIRLRKGHCVPVKVTHLKNGFKFEVVR